MRTVKLRVVPPEQRNIPWYQRRWAVRGREIFRQVDAWLWELSQAMVIVLAAIVGIVLIAMGMLAGFVGGPRR